MGYCKFWAEIISLIVLISLYGVVALGKIMIVVPFSVSYYILLTLEIVMLLVLLYDILVDTSH